MTSYEDIFKCFLRKIHDRELARQMEYDPESVQEDLIGYLHSAVAKIGYLDRTGITFDDDALMIEEDLTDKEIELYALGMQIEWLTPLVMRRTNIAQMFTGKETSYFSQASHLNTLKEMLHECKNEVIKITRDHHYEHNSYIDGD